MPTETKRERLHSMRCHVPPLTYERLIRMADEEQTSVSHIVRKILAQHAKKGAKT